VGVIPSNNPSDLIFDPDGNLLLTVLGLTYPPDTPGGILKYSLAGGDPLENLVSGVLGIGAIAWIAPVDAIAGDFDGNGTVAANDYAKWNNDFGKLVAKGSGADGNGDGIVDAADYTVWRDHLGATIGTAAVAANTTVPEPSSLLLAAVCLLTTIGGRINRRGSG
jgi:hypothetical protein